MAIRAPEYITADPVGNWAKSFQVADTSARDHMRLQMQQRQMMENAVQQARDNRANDFKLMLAAVNAEGEAEDRVLRREQQGFSNDMARFNADTSRMNAYTTRDRANRVKQYNDDPLGLRDTPVSNDAVYDGESIPGGQNTPEDIDVPDDFGGFVDPVSRVPVTEGTPYGAGIDADVSNKNNPALRQLEQDNATWASGGTPASAAPVTPLVDMAGPDAGPDNMPPPDPVRPEVAPVDTPTTLDDMRQGFGTSMPVPSAVPSGVPDDQLLPPPVTSVPSFSDGDISQSARNDLFELYKVNAGLTKKATLAGQSAARTAAAMKQVQDPALRQKYAARLNSELAESKASAGAANEAKFKAVDAGKKAGLLQKRQDELSALSHLDGILPEADRKAIMDEASDLKTGGAADRKITILKAYDQTRQKFGLEHRSNGLKTAEMVARIGLDMETKEALADKEQSQKADSYRKLIDDSKDAEPEDIADLKKELNKNLAGDMQWKRREAALKKAVRDDTWTPPTVEEVTEQATVQVTPPAAAQPLPPVSKNPDAPMADSPETWNAIKAQTLTQYPGLEAELKAIAQEKPFFRAQSIRNAIAKVKQGGRMGAGKSVAAQIERSGNNEVNLEEVATALVAEMNEGRAPQPTGKFTIKRL